MSSDDCFELGRQSYVNHDYYHTVLWMNEAMARMLEEPTNHTQSFTKADILEYLAFSTYKEGESKSESSFGLLFICSQSAWVHSKKNYCLNNVVSWNSLKKYIYFKKLMERIMPN